MKGLHHLLKLIDHFARLPTDAVPLMRGKKRQRVVTPIVLPFHRLAMKAGDGEFMHGHQLDRGDAERFEVRNLLDDPQIRAGVLHFAGLVLGKAADMSFVDDGLGDAGAKMAVPFPFKVVIHDDALGRANDAVRCRLKIAGQRLGIRVNQPGLAVEPLAGFGIARAIRLKVIKLPGAGAGNEDAPDISPAVGLALEGDGLRRLAVFHFIVQQEPHFLGAAAEHDKLHAIIMENGSIRQHVRELEFGMDVSHEHGGEPRACSRW